MKTIRMTNLAIKAIGRSITVELDLNIESEVDEMFREDFHYILFNELRFQIVKII